MAPVSRVDVVHSANPHEDTCVLIDYRPYLQVDAVASSCRDAWLLDPDWAGSGELQSDSRTMLQPLFEKIQNASQDDLKSAENPDKETVHTPLRDAVYFTWNHVFYDISRYFELECGHASYNPPAHHVMELRYPENIEEGQAVKVGDLELDCNIIFAPTFLDPGVKIWVLVGGEKQSALAVDSISTDPRPTFVFDASDTTQTYRVDGAGWIRSGRSLQVFASGNFGHRANGLAAVIVYGKYMMGEGLSPLNG